MLATWRVQQGFYAKLAADNVLISMVNGIYENTAQNAAFPYIIVGESSGNPDDLLNETGSQETLTVHIWDQNRSMWLVKQTMERVYLLLHHVQLEIADAQFVECRCENTNAFAETDEIRHGIMRFRVITFNP